jgi:hypothetical protein
MKKVFVQLRLWGIRFLNIFLFRIFGTPLKELKEAILRHNPAKT